MSKETYGLAPPGISQDEWEAQVLTEVFKLAEHRAKWRHSVGADEAMREAKEYVRGRVNARQTLAEVLEADTSTDTSPPPLTLPLS